MIVSFADPEAEKIWRGVRSRRLPSDIQATALRKLRQLDACLSIDEMRRPPGDRLELLRGDRKGAYSVRVNDQWRLCFKWTAKGAEDVEIIDDHG